MNDVNNSDILEMVSPDNTIESEEFFDLFRLNDEFDDEAFSKGLDFLAEHNIKLLDKDDKFFEDLKNAPERNHYSGALKEYLNDISCYELLTKEEEIELSKLRINGTEAAKLLLEDPENNDLMEIVETGIDARDQLINHNLKLVVSIAFKYNCMSGELNDLIQDGNTGLVTAAEKYDYRVGCKFSTYAYNWIRQSMSKHFKTFNSSVKIPTSVQNDLSIIRRLKNQLVQQYGTEDITPEQVLQIADERFTLEKITHLMSLDLTTVSLDKNIDSSDDSDTFRDLIKDENEENKVDDIYSSKSFEKLDDREKDILLMFYKENIKLVDIATKYDISINRVRQIKDRAKRKLEVYYKEENGN